MDFYEKLKRAVAIQTALVIELNAQNILPAVGQKLNVPRLTGSQLESMAAEVNEILAEVCQAVKCYQPLQNQIAEITVAVIESTNLPQREAAGQKNLIFTVSYDGDGRKGIQGTDYAGAAFAVAGILHELHEQNSYRTFLRRKEEAAAEKQFDHMRKDEKLFY